MGEERRTRLFVKAVDTNVLARYIVRDDPLQAERAEQVLRDGAFLPITVLLETAWLLAVRYGLGRRNAALAIATVLDLPSVEVADEALTRWAIGRVEGGADIADMFHLVAARSRDAFVTFDTGIEKEAGSDAPVMVETLS